MQEAYQIVGDVIVINRDLTALDLFVQDFEFNVPPLEFEILYKELVLKSDKDISDAKHLRTVFSEILDGDRFRACKEAVKND